MFIEQAQSMTLILQMSKFDPNAALKLEGQLIDGKLPEYDYNTGLTELNNSINKEAEKLRQETIKGLDVTNYESPYAMGSGITISTDNIKVNIDYKLKSSEYQENHLFPFYFFPEKENGDGKLTQNYIKFGGEYGIGGTLTGEIEIGLVSSSNGRVNPYITINGGVGKGISAEIPIKFGVNEIKGRENPHSLSGIDSSVEGGLEITTPWRGFSWINGDAFWRKEMGLSIGGSVSGTGSLTLVIPSFKDIGEFAGDLFKESDFANNMWKDLDLNIEIK